MNPVRSVLGAVAAGGLVITATTATAATVPSAAATSAAAAAPSTGCQLANGVKHVIAITFDNVHFFRDNPNVPSDLEQLPALKNFIESNGTLLSNNHTPLIAHTADDIITNDTGLYGDRQGVGIANSYDVYNSTGGVSSESAFSYWTGTHGIDAFPNMPYSATVPAAGSPPATPPAPWAPFTQAGCNVGAVSTANMELENTNPDLANVFGSSSPEVAQLNADPDSFKDQETNDYVGLAVHCARQDSFCSSAQAVKFGQTTPSPTAAPDVLPDEPGGYQGFQALFGSKYLTSQLSQAATSAGERVVNGHTYPVTDAQGKLTDLNGKTIVGQFAQTPGFPGFSFINAAESLSYVADMQETGVPITYAYMADLHEQFPGQTGCSSAGEALGPGDPCYEDSAAFYNAAFTTFFQRLADDGITAANTEFIIAADEGDHFAGANVGRAVSPACTGTPGVAVDTATVGQTPFLCSYPAGTIGEVASNIHSLLAFQTGDTASFFSQPQGEAVYATGSGNTPATIRQLEHDVSSLKMIDPYDGARQEPVSKWMADPKAEQLLHFVDADSNRTPSFTVFPNSDVFFSQGTSDSCPTGTTTATSAAACNLLNSGFAWNHGYYAPEVDTTWLGLVGPGVAHRGLDGPDPTAGANSSGHAASDLRTVPQVSRQGTWSDHTDIRPTLMALVGLKDDYTEDGRVLTEDLTISPGRTSSQAFLPLAGCYKQLNSSVGRFGTDVLKADTAALETGSAANDLRYQSFQSSLTLLGSVRDSLAGGIKQELFDAEFNYAPLPRDTGNQIGLCNTVLRAADSLAAVAPGHDDVRAQLSNNMPGRI
jgi:hypothetical protein